MFVIQGGGTMNYKDLKGKTVFDFCNDVEILAKVTGFSKPSENKEYIENFSSLVHAQMLQKLAVEIHNEDLETAAAKLENELWKEWNTACDDASQEGCIID